MGPNWKIVKFRNSTKSYSSASQRYQNLWEEINFEGTFFVPENHQWSVLRGWRRFSYSFEFCIIFFCSPSYFTIRQNWYMQRRFGLVFNITTKIFDWIVFYNQVHLFKLSEWSMASPDLFNMESSRMVYQLAERSLASQEFTQMLQNIWIGFWIMLNKSFSNQ